MKVKFAAIHLDHMLNEWYHTKDIYSHSTILYLFSLLFIILRMVKHILVFSLEQNEHEYFQPTLLFLLPDNKKKIFNLKRREREKKYLFSQIFRKLFLTRVIFDWPRTNNALEKMLTYYFQPSSRYCSTKKQNNIKHLSWWQNNLFTFFYADNYNLIPIND